MASPTPVLPEVGSTIVPPGFRWPSRSAASISGRPIRSFTDPPGFRYSSFASSSGPPGGASFWSRTIGVLPTSSSAVGNSLDIGRSLGKYSKRATARSYGFTPTISPDAWASDARYEPRAQTRPGEQEIRDPLDIDVEHQGLFEIAG